MNARILVIDDEEDIRNLVVELLGRAGFDVQQAADGRAGLRALHAAPPDLVLLDVSMPELDGWQTLERIRDLSDVPVLMVTARGEELERVRGLKAGADDYVTKPFGMDELLARIRAAIRRSSITDEAPSVATDDFVVDLAAHRVSRTDGRDVSLTPTEWLLVEVLVRNRDRLVTQRQLLNEVWGPNAADQSHYLRVYMAHLRHKLEKDPARPRYLVTEPGVGYRLLTE